MATRKPKEDPINPSYYKKGEINTFDFIKEIANELPGLEALCAGNVIKYVARYRQKGGLLDLKKAQWYLEQLIEQVEE